jgi:hypothetical protein
MAVSNYATETVFMLQLLLWQFTFFSLALQFCFSIFQWLSLLAAFPACNKRLFLSVIPQWPRVNAFCNLLFPLAVSVSSSIEC